MDDEWEDQASSSTPRTSANLFKTASEGGRGFSSGRGFKSAESDGFDDFQTGASSDNFSQNSFGGGGGRGRGRGRGDDRGGRRGHGGFRDRDSDRNGGGGGGWNSTGNGFDNDNDEEGSSDRWGGGDSNDAWSRGADMRGRGGGRGRGRGRGGRGGESNGDGWGRREANEGNENGAPPVKREIYVPPEGPTDDELFTSTITSGINFIKLDDIEVNVSGEDVPQPIRSFETSGLRPHILGNVKKSGYTKPTPIQKYAIPIIMAGRDLMGCAQTGSGKTAAFLLPIINKLLEVKDPAVVEGSCCQPRVIIVSPTRELTIQIYEQAKKFAYDSTVKTVVAYGGASVFHQKKNVMSGCHILVATPGRLNDFVNQGIISFASVQFVVLDEADRMLDMGFLPTVEQMMDHDSMVPTGERQTLMFSATFPEEIQTLAAKFLTKYVFIAVGIVGSASTDVEQVFHQVKRFDKRELLIGMLKEAGDQRTVVFVETKRNADFLATLLSERDIKTTSIHGDRLQREREQALFDFRKGIHNILVATGVAARGLDIKGVEHVINYDLPKSIDEYVHRIGRTGRLGNRGKASSFFDPEVDSNLAGNLSRILKQAGQEVPDWLASGDFSTGGRSDNFGGRDIRKDQFKAQNIVLASEEPDEQW